MPVGPLLGESARLGFNRMVCVLVTWDVAPTTVITWRPNVVSSVSEPFAEPH